MLQCQDAWPLNNHLLYKQKTPLLNMDYLLFDDSFFESDDTDFESEDTDKIIRAVPIRTWP